MYHNCIYCSAPLGSNEVLELFPVGGTLAFDAVQGRLWAICPRCARWNLAPLEERWEPVEQAEQAFLDARLRVQKENIGLARMRDGTRLLRIGLAPGRELAAWRYGTQLRSRRRSYLAGSAGLLAAGAGLWLFGNALVVGGTAMVYLGWDLRRSLRDRRVLHWVPATASPTGTPFPLRRGDLGGARLGAEQGVLHLDLPQAPLDGVHEGAPLRLAGADAQRLLSRAMIAVNQEGATQPQVDAAVAALAEAGPQALMQRAAEQRRSLGLRWGVRGNPLFSFTRALVGEAIEGARSSFSDAPRRSEATRMLSPPDASLQPAEALAFEMALHEEDERRALEGELTVLQAAWRDAEEIAAVADRLVFGVPTALPNSA